MIQKAIKLKKQIVRDFSNSLYDTDIHSFQKAIFDEIKVLSFSMREDFQRVNNCLKDMTIFTPPCAYINQQCELDTIQIFDLNTCIRASYLDLKNQISADTNVHLNLTPLPKVQVNVAQINQALKSLIVNASEAISDDGNIVVASKHTQQSIIITISDDGCGISKNAQQNVFDPLYTTKKQGESTGLGLAISHDIIKKHGGKLSVSSELNKGTKFTFTLPIYTTQADSLRASTPIFH